MGKRSRAAMLAAIVLLAIVGVVAWLWSDGASGAAEGLAVPRGDASRAAAGRARDGDAPGPATPAVAAAVAPLAVDEVAADATSAWPEGIAQACLSGRVVDVRGAPWPGARVVFVPDRATTEALEGLPGGKPAGDADPIEGLPRTTTDAAGRFELCGPWLAQGREPGSWRGLDPVLAITAPDMAWQGHPALGFDGRPLDVGDLVLAQPASGFTLRVVDEQGRPLADVLAKMSALSYQGPADDDPAPPTRLAMGVLGRTGADGRLRVDHRWPSRLFIDLSKPGYEGHFIHLPLDAGVHAELDEVVLTHGQTLSGRVIDGQGLPVAGVEILALSSSLAEAIGAKARGEIDLVAMLLDRGGGSSLRTHAESDGSFVLGGIGRAFTSLSVIATAPGFAPALLEAVVPGSKGLQVVLEPAAVLEIEVADAVSGERIVDAELRALRRTGFAESEEPHTLWRGLLPLAVEGGRVRDPGAVGTLVFAAAPGHLSRSVEVPGCAPGEQRDVRIALEPGAGVQGQVVDDLGDPVADARLRLTPPSEALERLLGVEEQRSGDDGRFAFPTLLAGRWSVEVSKPGHAAAQLDELDSTAPPDPWEIVLPRGARIVGTLLDAAGAPAVGRVVEATRPLEPTPDESSEGVETVRARVDREGHFALVGLRPGLWTLRATPGVEAQVALAVAQQVELSLRLAPTLRLEGRTHAGPDDLPQVRVQATLAGQDGAEAEGARPVSTRSGIGGRYALELPGPGSYRLHFYAREGPRLRRTLDAHPGDAPLLDVDFGSGRLAGRLLAGDERRPLSQGAWITLRRGDEYVDSCEPDAEGHFALAPLSAGAYLVAVRSELTQPFELALELGPGEVRDDLELVLQPAAYVEGTVSLSGGENAGVFVHLRRTDDAAGYHVSELDEEGWFEFAQLQPGPWRLDVTTFPEAELGRGEGLRGEPGAELPLLSGERFRLEPLEKRVLKLTARMPAGG